MQIGSTVYWIASDRIYKGEVISANCRTMTTDGNPVQIVVDSDGTFKIFNNGNSWEQWYDSAAKAYRAGVESVNKRTLSCTQSMSNLMDDLSRIIDEEEKVKE